MDSSEAPMKEDTLSYTPDSSFLAFLERLPPLQQPVNTYKNDFSSYCFLDEYDSATLIYTPPRSRIKDSYDSKKVSEEPLPLLEEPKTVHQEKSSYLDEVAKLLNVESPVQGLRESQQVALNEWRNHQDRAAQLMPEPLLDIEECESLEVWLALELSAEKVSKDGSEASKKHSFPRHFLQFKEAAPNSHGGDEIGSKTLIEDSYYFNQWSEGPLLLSEETKTVLQEKPTYVDETGKIQDVESSKECRGVESNFSADAVSEVQHWHGSIAQNHQDCNPELTSEPMQLQPEENEWWNHLDCDPQLMPEPMQLQPEANEQQKDYNPQMMPEPMQLQPEGNELQILQDCNPQLIPKPMQQQPEANEWQNHQDRNPQLMPEPMQQKQPEVNEWQKDCKPQLMPEPMQPQPEVNEWSQPVHNVTPALGLSAKIVEARQKHSVVRRCLRFEEFATNLTALHPVSKDLTASSLTAMNSTSSETKMNKLPETSQPITKRVHDNKRLQHTSSGNAEEFSQPTMLEKQMNTTPNTTDGKKRGCNCKKSKCIKRFCGCFAANSYCGEFCFCQGCSNRPDKPDDAKQITESHKPIASASKILQNTADIPLNNMEDVNPYGKKDLLSADLHRNNVRRFSLNDVHGLSPATPLLRMSQLAAANASPLTPLTNGASMFGASCDRRHIRPHGNSLPMTRLGKITNQQSLESTNPVSFASNIIQNATDTPSYHTVDANLKTPSSPKWHKQGCACVKCNKLSCDCYMIRAGYCTSKCRCRQGCGNSYGNREDNVARVHGIIKESASGKVEKAPDAIFHDVNMSQSSVSLNNVSQSQVTPVSNVIGSNGQYLLHGSIIHRWPQ